MMFAATTRAAGMEAKEGHVAFRGYRTWYRITGNLDSPRLPWLSPMGDQAAATTMSTGVLTGEETALFLLRSGCIVKSAPMTIRNWSAAWGG